MENQTMDNNTTDEWNAVTYFLASCLPSTYMIHYIEPEDGIDIFHFNSIKVDNNNWISPWKVFLDILALVSMMVGFSMSCIIIKYLDNKPTGSQSVIDVPTKIIFKAIRALNVVLCSMSILDNHILDPGEIITNVVAWSIYNLITIISLMLTIISALQIVKLVNPSYELPTDDKVLSISLKVMAVILMTVTPIVCPLFDINPPMYFMMRGIPFPTHLPIFVKIKAISSAITFILYYSVRITICINIKSMKSGDLLGWKTFLVLNTSPLFLIFFRMNVAKYVDVFTIVFITLNLMCIPLFSVLSHYKIKNYALRHNMMYCNTISMILKKQMSKSVTQEPNFDLQIV